MRFVRTITIAGLIVGLGVAVMASAAGAHVTDDKDEVAAGGYDAVTLTVPHGCDGSPTTQLAVQIPEGFMSISPQVNPGWEITVQTEPLDTPIDDGEGGQVTERVASVTFTGGPLPAEFRDTFTIGFQAPDTPGEMAYFKSVQTCDQGETGWIEEWDGEGEEPEHPAPALRIVEAADDDHGATGETEEAAGSDEAASGAATSASTADDDGPSTALVIVALVLGALGAVLGGTSLVVARRRP